MLFLLFTLQSLSVKFLGRIEERQNPQKCSRNREKGRQEAYFTWDKNEGYKLFRKKYVGWQGTGSDVTGFSPLLLLHYCNTKCDPTHAIYECRCDMGLHLPKLMSPVVISMNMKNM